jgi:hypothetical protein
LGRGANAAQRPTAHATPPLSATTRPGAPHPTEVVVRHALRASASLLVLLALAALLPSSARAVPQYAARTGLMCGSCHFDPNGGGPRNEFGHAFAAHRHSLTPDTSGPWSDLSLTNRVSDTFPLYVSLNQRFMLLTNRHTDVADAERLGFYNMENSLQFAFQPHARLTVVMAFDAFAAGATSQVVSKEAFALLRGLPLDGYLKAGRFRVPYGLRLDDHTVATRNGYGDLTGIARFLPYDPRQVDMGVELGAERGSFFGRVAFTNGTASVFGADPYAEAKALKLGYNGPHYQGGFSLYDDVRKLGSDVRGRSTRWGYYGLSHAGPVAVIGEIGAGTDENAVTDQRVNLLAWFAEADYAPARSVNLRVRLDHLETDRSSDPFIAEINTSQRYAIEGEWVPVPFAELRWTYRYIDPKSDLIADERQSYLQLHLSY